MKNHAVLEGLLRPPIELYSAGVAGGVAVVAAAAANVQPAATAAAAVAAAILAHARIVSSPRRHAAKGV